MAEFEPGQAWEIYSNNEHRWTRAIVTKIEDDRVTLRYEGFLEFVTVDVGDMQNNPDLYRPAMDLD